MIQHAAVFAAATLLVAYGALALTVNLLADRVIFPFPPSSYADGPDVLKLPTADGTLISAVHLPASRTAPVVLFSHGNGEDLGILLPLLEAFRRRGVSVFAYDYPGYGTSGGRPSEKGVYASADAAYRYLTEVLAVPPERVILYGRSVGSGPAFWLAERFPVAGIVTEGAFTSTFRVIPWTRFLPGDRFNNLTRLDGLTVPLLLVHGTRDEIIPFSHALQLADRAGTLTRFLWVDGAGHNNLIEFAGPAYWDAVLAFIREATGS